MIKKSLFSKPSVGKIFASIALAIGLLSVSGWIFDLTSLKAVIPNLMAIKFNTALCILLLGISALCFSSPKNKNPRFCTLFVPTIVFIISCLTLFQYLGQTDLGIDELFFKDTELTYLKRGRMSFFSALVLFLTSSSVFFRQSKRLSVISSLLQVSNLFISMLALLGYLYGASGLLALLPYKTVAPQTVLALVFINLSLLLSDKDSVILRPFYSQQSGGVLGRKLLPISMLSLIGIGFCVRELTQHFKIDASIDGAVVVTCSLFFISYFIWGDARRLNLMDDRLAEKRKKLEKLNSELEFRIEERTAALKAAVEIREEVLAVVSHDLKNPLAAISLSADFLNQEKELPWPVVRDSGMRIQKSVKQMQVLINDLLDFSKMESSTFAVEPSVENPGEIINQVVDSYISLAKQKQIVLRVSLPENLRHVYCDGGRVVQVLSNLIGNSLKFCPKGSDISITASDVNQELQIVVADNGPGINEEQIGKVFDRFWQAEKTKKLGSGLGLSIVQGIVQAHGGKIWVESDYGAGTAFYFTLPHAKPDQIYAHKTKFNAAFALPKHSLTGRHILLVDDSEDNLVFVKMVLDRAGAEVSVAHSAAEALTQIEHEKIDLVITDIEMPDENGFQLLTKVRQAFHHTLPVISFSAHTSGVQFEKIKNACFDGNIFKPVKADILVCEITRVMREADT